MAMTKGETKPAANRRKKTDDAVAEADGLALKALRRAPADLSPLEYMLSVVRDPSASPDRRDRMACAAAPYCHAKANAKGKKEQAAEVAATADRGTHWEALLQ